jgi:DmsE family decaheme c-type cytochrome
VGGLTAFSKAEPAVARSAACLRCHGSASSLHDFTGGEHAKAKLACTSCHAMHVAKSQPLLRTAQPALCTDCHPDVKAAFALPEHHKVPEGVLGCGDCHQPHGTRNPSLTKAPGDRTCFACHADIEGPFVFEHAGLISEGCRACHEPHGSIGRHLLKRRQVGQLCLECHSATPRDHTLPSFRDCTRCHTAIHGSNTSPRLLER